MMSSSYESVVCKESAIWPGVSYVVERMSFGRRIELMKLIREATVKGEFLHAGGESGTMSSAITSAEVSRLYVQWGLKEIRGLQIDGASSAPDILIHSGPEELFHEALAFVMSECQLDDKEKKT
jgi:hypothetical protein